MKYVLILLVLLSGCAGYQFGDVTTTLLDNQREYCSTADPVKRAVLLATIRTQIPGYPVSGVCTAAEIAARDNLSDVDVEQALEDQRRFNENLDTQTPEDSPSPEG